MTAVLLNATTLVKGGALQVCTGILAEAARDDAIEWHYALSPAVDQERQGLDLTLDQARVHRVMPSPSGSRAARSELARLVRESGVDAVFTVFGPAYVRFDKPHLMGVADAWVTHPNWQAYASLRSLRELLRKPALALYKGLWYRSADRWVVEADVARDGLHAHWRVALADIDVVPNNCGAHYRIHPFRELAEPPAGRLEVLTLSAYYAHKNLALIPAVAAQLARLGQGARFRFHLTLPSDSAGWRAISHQARRLGVEAALINHGPIAVVDGPALYDGMHVMFLPTLLETFSATYPEAMAAGRPIVTSDLPFARSACGAAALYYRAGDAAAAAQALLELAGDTELWRGLIALGRERLDELPDPATKYRLYVDAIHKLPEHQSREPVRR